MSYVRLVKEKGLAAVYAVGAHFYMVYQFVDSAHDERVRVYRYRGQGLPDVGANVVVEPWRWSWVGEFDWLLTDDTAGDWQRFDELLFRVSGEPDVPLWALRLREARMMDGSSQVSLAEDVGISRVSVSRYEAGEVLPSVDVLTALCRVLGVSSDWVLGLDMGYVPRSLKVRVYEVDLSLLLGGGSWGLQYTLEPVEGGSSRVYALPPGYVLGRSKSGMRLVFDTAGEVCSWSWSSRGPVLSSESGLVFPEECRLP